MAALAFLPPVPKSVVTKGAAAPHAALAYASGAPQGRTRKNRVSESPGFSAREQKVENHVSAVGHDFTSLAWWVVVVLLLIAVLLVLILRTD